MSGIGTLAMWVVAVFAGAVIVLGLLLAVLGPERVWGVFGPADLGDVSFEKLQRRTSPNEALAAPEGLGPARRDITSEVYPVPADRLREAFRRAVASEARLERVAVNDADLTERYVQRTPLLGYPDTVVVRFVDLGQGTSTIVLYSRSKLGRSDLGANKARLERWLAALGRELRSEG